MTLRYRALVEDAAHEAMLRGLLDRNSAAPRLHVDWYPRDGKGAGEQHVRTQFPGLVNDLRTKRDQKGLWGIVVTDGDTVGPRARKDALMYELARAGAAPLGARDQVVLLLPTRNGETWAWCILGNEVDEATDFKSKLAGANLRATFRDRWAPAQPTEPPSLAAGRLEWARLR